MKKYKIIILIASMLIIILGIFLIKGCTGKKEKSIKEPLIKLYLKNSDEIIQLTLEEYLIGTVLAEMPASFELEALKAQAVCARTYALRKLATKHFYPRNADLSDDINTCQAYRPAHSNLNQKILNKITRAVKETRGEIMLYDNEPIDALYHSTCGGRTESAKYAWGKDVAYLKSVPCKYCKESKHFRTEIKLPSDQISNLKILHKTPTGRILGIKVNNTVVSGNKFRMTYNLPSTWFNIEKKDYLLLKTRGYGHGVGMCQYGANGLAKCKKNYREILNYYYRDIKLYKIDY